MHAWEALVPVPLMLGGWVLLLGLPAPNLVAGSLAYLAFHVIGLVLVVTAVTRMLGDAPVDGASVDDEEEDGGGGGGGRDPGPPPIGPDSSPGLRAHPSKRTRRPQLRPARPRRGDRRPRRIPERPVRPVRAG